MAAAIRSLYPLHTVLENSASRLYPGRHARPEVNSQFAGRQNWRERLAQRQTAQIRILLLFTGLAILPSLVGLFAYPPTVVEVLQLVLLAAAAWALSLFYNSCSR